MPSNKVPVTFAALLYDRFQPLQSGEVTPEGIDLNFLALSHPRDVFDRMAGGKEFDASELSLSEYICRYATGLRDFVALPVFPSRAFRHGYIAVNSNIVKEPKDLNGMKIGVPLYTMTAAVWIRSVLKQHGVDLDSVQWVQGSLMSATSYGKPASMPLTKPVNIVQNDSGKSLSQMLEDGDIAATIGADLPPSFRTAEHVKRLFPNSKEVEKAYFKEKGIFPIMHTVVVKRELVEKYPWLPSSLFNALNDAKEVSRVRMRFLDALRYMLPWLPQAIDEIDEVFGGDAWVYGIEPNRKTLEALVDALYDQAMISSKPTLEELFAPIRGQNWKVGWGTTLPKASQ
jgi:4,5-dihydroxyphthalate decarboxylase